MIEITQAMIDAGAEAILRDRLSIIQITDFRGRNTVGWIRAQIEAEKCLKAALELDSPGRSVPAPGMMGWAAE